MTFDMEQPAKPFDMADRRPSLRDRLVMGAYWVLVTGFFLYEKRYLIYKTNLPYFFACVGGRVVLLIAIAYLNLHYFLPKFLARKRYYTYAAAVLASVLCYVIIQSFYDFYLYGFVVGPMYNSDLSEAITYNFFSTLWYLGLMLSLKLSLDWYGQQLLIQKITVEKLQAEVGFLRAQVNPHFLFNALNNLYALTIKRSELAPDVVLKLSEMMEYMLYESDETLIPLDKEIRYLNNYLELEKLRQGNNAQISLEVTGNTDRCMIPPFLLLPLVENAFKHGISRIINDAYLRISILVDEGISITIINNKLNEPRPAQNGGIGLTNLQQRLELIYPGEHSLSVENTADLHRVSLNIGRIC